MELQRRAILRKDFSTARRGYDPAEVEAHLAEIADAVEQMRGTSTAGAAAQRVQAIVEAAERSAQEIETEAQTEAEQRRGQASEIRTAAEEQAERVRRRAQEQAEAARKRVQSDAADGLERATEAERLLEEAGGELDRLRSALSKLRGTLEQPVDEVEVEAEGEPEPAEPKAEAPKGTRRRREAQARAAEAQAAEKRASEQLAADEEAFKQEAAEEQAEPATAHAELPEADQPVEETQESPAEAAHDAAPQSNKGGQPKDGAEGARLIALNMALNGTPREETQRYLAENFELDDVDGLLNEVYSG
jgi:DivIVA domain-containing protein